MQSVLKKQKGAKILVGDPHQQVYRFRGAMNAMDSISADETARLTQVGLILYIITIHHVWHDIAVSIYTHGLNSPSGLDQPLDVLHHVS